MQAQIEELRNQLLEREVEIKTITSANVQLQAENDQIKAINTETMTYLETITKEKKELQEKNEKISSERRKQTETAESNKYLLQKKVEDLKTKLLDDQSKIQAFAGDQEILKNKIETELRATYEAQINSLRRSIDEKDRECFKYKAEISSLNNRLEAKTEENTLFIREIKERHKEQIDDLTEEINKLNEIVDSNKEKDIIRKLEKQNEEYRSRLSECDRLRDDLANKRDESKRVLELMQIEKSKAYDTYINERREYKNEIEMLRTKLISQEEDIKREINATLKTTEELRSVQAENDKLNIDVRKYEEKELAAEEKLTDALIKLKEKESEMDLLISKNAEEDDEKAKRESEDKNNLQTQNEELERKISLLEEESKNALDRTDVDIAELRKEYSICREEKMALNKKLLEARDQVNGIKKALEIKLEEYDQLEREYRKTQDSYRNAMNQYNALGKERESNQKIIKEMQSQYIAVMDCQKLWERERVELHKVISDLTEKLEKSRSSQQEEIAKFKDKMHQYKIKLKKANTQLKSFADKFAQVSYSEENDELML